jgi:hypothetical protein
LISFGFPNHVLHSHVIREMRDNVIANLPERAFALRFEFDYTLVKDPHDPDWLTYEKQS